MPLDHQVSNATLFGQAPLLRQNRSAAKHLHSALPHAVVAWGGKELIEFQRQSATFASAWEAATGSVQRLIFPENNHLDQCDEVAKMDGKITHAILSMMGLS